MYKIINNFIKIAIVSLIFFITIAYSVLNKELTITGDLIYRAEADIRITNVKLDSVSNTVESFSPNFSKDEVILGFNMESSTSTITYKIEVTNFSDVEMGIFKIDGLPNSYEIKDYVLKEKLVDSTNNSKSGMIKKFTIVLKADDNFKGLQSIRLKIEFEPFYQITYSGFKDDSNYLKEIIKGENYSQTLDNSVDDILVTMNNISTNNYTFDNKKLEIKNVDGNILIENNTPNAPVLNGDMIPVYYEATSNTEGVWRKADVNNIDNNWYDYKTQKWANAVTVVEESVKDLSGNYNSGIVYGAKVENGEAYFDGVDDFINCGLENYDFGQDFTVQIAFTINQFMEGKDYNNNSILGNQEGGGFAFQIESQRMTFEVHNGEKYEILSIQNYKLNTLYNITLTFNKNEMKAYVQEGEQTTIYTKELEQEISVKKSTMPFILGGNPNPNGTDSESNITISKLLLYDRCLSNDEINSNTQNNDSLLINLDFNKLYRRDTYKNFDIIPMCEINTMWVWIPRYSYTIKKETGSSDYYGKQELGRTTIPTKALPGEIDVKFINNSINEQGKAQYTGNMITNWYTNEAFNFDAVKRNGMWIGKFEPTGRLEKNDACVDENCNVSDITIKPNVKALVNQKVGSFFYMARSMQKDVETFGFSASGNIHMIKDDEWGAVAYLSQSKYGKYGNSDYAGANKEVYQNKSNKQTGNSNGTPGQSTTTTPQYKYNDMTNLGVGKGQAGPGASTTGTIYGIYDMSGGMHEYTMAAITYSSSDEFPMSGYNKDNNSGFTGKLSDGTDFNGIDFFSKSNSIYYNLYKTTESSSEKACSNNICYGYALSETKYWYGDAATFVNIEHPWMTRGGYATSTTTSGVFYFNGNLDGLNGVKNGGTSTRVAIAS